MGVATSFWPYSSINLPRSTITTSNLNIPDMKAVIEVLDGKGYVWDASGK